MITRFIAAGAVAALTTVTLAAQTLNPTSTVPLRLLTDRDNEALWVSEAMMHGQFIERFRTAVGLGRARMGSASLRIGPRMQLRISMPQDEGSSRRVELTHSLNTLELIGIARHSPPVAFVIESHQNPSVEKTRPLTSFEERALRVLRDGQEVAAATEGNTRLVVGAIRAEEGVCISCHAGVKPGELLGAFSYRLTREQTSAKP
jgi:hypothetical protein